MGLTSVLDWSASDNLVLRQICLWFRTKGEENESHKGEREEPVWKGLRNGCKAPDGLEKFASHLGQNKDPHYMASSLPAPSLIYIYTHRGSKYLNNEYLAQTILVLIYVYIYIYMNQESSLYWYLDA